MIHILHCIALLAMLGTSAGVLAQQAYTEDFTTSTYKDVSSTTADWNLTNGELRLHPFFPTLEGACDTPGFAYCVALSGGHAYVAGHSAGLQVIDISDPTNPTLVGSYNTPDRAYAVAVSGNYAFVTDVSVLQVIDISNPTIPMLVGSCNTPGLGVAVSGGYAYVASGGSLLQIVDISDPANPSPAGSYTTPDNAYSIAVSGNHAFVADDMAGLLVIDISDPTNPSFSGSFDTSGYAYGVSVSGDYAFVADDLAGLQVVDISDPKAPTFGGNCNTPGRALGVTVAGDHAYVADEDSGLQVIDISDPTNPRLIGNYNTPGITSSVSVSGAHAYLADGDAGLQVIKISLSIVPAIVGTCDTPGLACEVEISGNHAFLADSEFGLQVINIFDPVNPVLMGAFNTPGIARGVATSGNYVFVADSESGLQVVDISNPSSPTLAGSCDTPDVACDVVVSGDYAFVADRLTGLQVIDISDPTNPTIAGSYDTGEAYKVTVSGRYAYVAADGFGLQIVDISDPMNPVRAGGYITNPYSFIATEVEVSGGFAYVVNQNGGGDLRVFDISDPTNPTQVGSCSMPNIPYGIAISGDRAFVAENHYSHIRVVDISDPTKPTLMGGCSTPGQANGVVISGDYAFVESGDSGLQVVKVFQSEVETDNNVCQSLAVDSSDYIIFNVRLIATQTSGVNWELSTDGGVNWQGVVPDGSWNTMLVPGTDLLWRSTHTWAAPGVNPSVSELELEWRVGEPMIDSIVDVPGDQGGWVRVTFERCAYDIAGGAWPEKQVVGYTVYREVPVTQFAKLAKYSEEIDSLELKFESETQQPKMFAPEGVKFLKRGERTYLKSSKENLAVPLGTWESIGIVFAMQRDSYTVLAPSVADSIGGQTPVLTNFYVQAHTMSPDVDFTSNVAGGYSIDDIAPDEITGLVGGYSYEGTGAATLLMTWDICQANDFDHFEVYGGDDFASSELRGATVATTWGEAVAVGGHENLWVVALDNALNMSVPVMLAPVSGVEETEAPIRSRLLPNHPNPFNPSTKINFTISMQGHVSVDIYAIDGKHICNLENGVLEPGNYERIWDGTNGEGVKVSSGVFFCRLVSGNFVETRKLSLIK